MSECYTRLGRQRDADTTRQMVRLVEGYLADFRPQKLPELLELLRKAGWSNPWHREALLFLIADAGETGDNRLGRYREKLKERDRRYEEDELFAALGGNY